MKKVLLISIIFLFGLGTIFAVKRINRVEQPTTTIASLTSLPELPAVPFGAKNYSFDQRQELIWKIIDIKLSTYPAAPNRNLRAGKHAGTGLNPIYTLKEDQLKTLALNYDSNSFNANQVESIKIIKKYNPNFKAFLYMDSGIQIEHGLTEFGSDIGNIDDENILWIQGNHPDWLLRDSTGNPLRSADDTLSNAGEYWPDPGNKGLQQFFAQKIQKVINANPDLWNGVLVDQFFGTISNYEKYAGTKAQTKYKTDRELQLAQLDFLKTISTSVQKTVIANLDGSASLLYPQFMVEIAKTAGGVENEIIPFENSDEADSSLLPKDSLLKLLKAIQQIPNDKHVRINSKPGEMQGNIDRTLYAYCTYLLISGPDKERYWTFKEGDSSIPHFWFKEFDLDLGKPLGEAQFGEVWSREFEKATVVVNPNREELHFEFSGPRYLVTGEEVTGMRMLPKASGLILVK